ncbi:hypothetical protein P5673_026410 [Acropora cervicornis]|uniref:Uncharacterized protein n=1 Tax=Acropora cervicornis TaxID=6130 RepID=A0AAD9Q0K8_ACRCE|nr:hypothetical protein P5673_026410 [Acropora cervicornis]
MQRIKKTARIAVLEGKPVRDEVRRGIRVYRATEYATTGASPNSLMFGRELRGKVREVMGQSKRRDDARIRCRDRKQKQKMKKHADKRRHTAVMKIEVGDTVLCKQEGKNSLTPLYDPDPMVVIGVKESMVTAKNSVRIRTRNYADWKLLSTVAGNHPRVKILMLNWKGLQLIGHVNPLKTQSNLEQTRVETQRHRIDPVNYRKVMNSQMQTATHGNTRVGREMGNPNQTVKRSEDMDPGIGPGHYIQRLYLRIVNICPSITLDVILTNIFILT